MKKIEAVIFDMDGVLIDTERVSFESYKKILKEYNYDISHEFYLTLLGRNVPSIKSIFAETYGSDFPFDEIYPKKSKLATETVDKNGVIIKEGAHELIDYLKDNKYKIAVATSTRKERAHKLLSEIGVMDKVDYIICGDQVENSKPDPEIFLKAAKGLDVEPEACVVIEDSEAGILAANSANMKGFNVPDMKMPDDNMKRLAFKICANLIEVKNYFEAL